MKLRKGSPAEEMFQEKVKLVKTLYEQKKITENSPDITVIKPEYRNLYIETTNIKLYDKLWNEIIGE